MSTKRIVASILLVGLASAAFAQGLISPDPVKTIASMSDKDNEVNYLAYVPTVRVRQEIVERNGKKVVETVRLTTLVPEARVFSLRDFEVTRVDGAKVDRAAFVTTLRKAGTPILFFGSGGSLSNFDRKFYRDDLFIVAPRKQPRKQPKP